MKINKIGTILLLSCMIVSAANAVSSVDARKAEKARDSLFQTISDAENALNALQNAKTDLLQGLFNKIYQDRLWGTILPGLASFSDKIVALGGTPRPVPSVGSYKLKYPEQSLAKIEDKAVLRKELRILSKVKSAAKQMERHIRASLSHLKTAKSRKLKGASSGSYEILERKVKDLKGELENIGKMRAQIQRRMVELSK